MTDKCPGSGSHVSISVGQQQQTGGYARPNVATDVHCPRCHRQFDRTRISYSDQGIPTDAQALIPRHNRKDES